MTSWALTVTGNGGVTETLTSGNSGFYVTGNALTATSGGLFFDFSATTLSNFLFQVSLNDGNKYWCDSAGRTNCYAGTSAVPQSYVDSSAVYDATPTGNVKFASVAAVPETATWAMMLAGFGMIGFAARRRSSVKTTVTFG